MKRLEHKTALVTGATSGIGKAAAFALAEEGCRLIICGRRLERLHEIQMELGADRCYVSQVDVRNYEEVKRFAKELPDGLRDVSILVNNAGLSRGLNKIQDGVLEDWNEMIDTNVKGLLYVTKEILPMLLKQESAHIVNIGSIAGHEVYTAGNVYCASKHAVDALTKGMRLDLNGTNVKVTTIDPGLAETEFSEVRFRGDKDRAKTVYKGMSPLTPQDIADAIVYAVTRPENVVIAEIILLPKAQASSTVVSRSNNN